jgi:phosphoribosyl-ATP pyrophosphohydrolase
MNDIDIIAELWDVIEKRARQPKDDSYVSRILTHRKGVDKSLEKVGEETVEFIIAMKNEDYKEQVEEAADLLFHFMVALRAADIQIEDVFRELRERRKLSGKAVSGG